MKYLKMLGLAAIAALGLMAFVGAGTASATTLCTNANGTSCYVSGQTYHATLKSATTTTLKDTSGNVLDTCNASTVTAEQTENSPTWLTLHVKVLEFPRANCTSTADKVKLGKLTVMWTSGNNGTVEADETEVTVELFGVSCTYGAGAGTHLGTFTGGASPTMAINAKVNKTAGGFLCPGTAVWEAEYELTSPHAVYAVI